MPKTSKENFSNNLKVKTHAIGKHRRLSSKRLDAWQYTGGKTGERKPVAETLVSLRAETICLLDTLTSLFHLAKAALADTGLG